MASKFYTVFGRRWRVNTLKIYHHISQVDTHPMSDDDIRHAYRVTVNGRDSHGETGVCLRDVCGETRIRSMPNKMEAFIRALLAMKGHGL
jgi:hypothetical protein